MFFITIANQVVMRVTFAKLNITYTFVDTSISNCVKNKLQVQLTGKKDLINWDGLRRRITTVSLIINMKA